MDLTQTTKMAYSIYLYRYKDFDCIKYNFNIPKHMNKSLKIYFESNKFALSSYTQYDMTQLQLRLIINYFIKNNQTLDKISINDYDFFKQQLLEYKNEFSLFINNTKAFNVKDLYKSFVKNEVPFYIFYYVLKYVKFKESFLDSEIIKTKLSNICKMMGFFKYFDKEYIKEALQEYQKNIDFS